MATRVVVVVSAVAVVVIGGCGTSGTSSTTASTTTATTVSPPVDAKFLLGDLCQPNYEEPDMSTYILGEGSDSAAFAVPVGMEFDWNSLKTGAGAGGFYTPICPDGFVALGCVGEVSLSNAVTSPAPTDVKRWANLRCVSNKYVEAATFSNLTWADRGSGSPHDGSVFSGVSESYLDQTLMGPCQCASGYPSSVSGYKLKSELFASPGADSPIKITPVANFQQSYADRDTGSNTDLSMWGPSLVPAQQQPEQVQLALGKTVDSMSETGAEVQWEDHESTTLRACANRDGYDGVEKLDSVTCYGSAPFCGGVKNDCWRNGMVYVGSDSDCQGKESPCYTEAKVQCRKILECCDGYELIQHDNADPQCERKNGLSSASTRRRQSGLMREVDDNTSTRIVV